jgi:hypothetical protein
LEVLRVKAPVRFQTRAATSGAGLQRRSKAAARRQCQRYQTRTETGHGAGICACSWPLFKKKSAATSRSVFAQLSSKIVKSNVLREVGCVACGPTPPPLTSPSPPLTQCYRRRPFWPASGATARPPHPRESPTCDGPIAAPPQRVGPALTPVAAAPRRLPLREERYSTWGDPRAVLPSGMCAAAI